MKASKLLVAMLLGLGIAMAGGPSQAQTGTVLVQLPSANVERTTIQRELVAALSASGKKLTQAQLDQTTRQIHQQLAGAGGTAEGKVHIDAWGLVIDVEW
jgi:hypothetical protein